MKPTILVIAFEVVAALAIIRISDAAGDYIDLVSIERMKSNVDGLLSRLACVDPVSAVCENFTGTGKEHTLADILYV